MFKKNGLSEIENKIINIEAGIQGNLKFSGPVNLRINGNFEGELEAKGTLIIGEKANVKGKIIKGDNITIAGRVKADVVCTKRLELSSSARVTGNIETPILVMTEGALLKGDCSMPVDEEHKESPSKKKKRGLI